MYNVYLVEDNFINTMLTDA